MDASSINASLMATVPIWGSRYQHGWPLRVIEESIISSETRKKACSCLSGGRSAKKGKLINE